MAEIRKTADKSGNVKTLPLAEERHKKIAPEQLPALSKDKAKLSAKEAVAAPSLSELADKAKKAAAGKVDPGPSPELTPSRDLLRYVRATYEKQGTIDKKMLDKAAALAGTLDEALAVGTTAGELEKKDDAKGVHLGRPFAEVVGRIFGRATQLSTTVTDALRVADVAHKEIDETTAGAVDITKTALQKALALSKTVDDAVSVAEKAEEVGTAFDSVHEEKAAAFSLAAKLCETSSQAIVLADHRNKDGNRDNYRAAEAYKRALELPGSHIETILNLAARNPLVSKEAYQELQRLSKPFYQRWFE